MLRNSASGVGILGFEMSNLKMTTKNENKDLRSLSHMQFLKNQGSLNECVNYLGLSILDLA